MLLPVRQATSTVWTGGFIFTGGWIKRLADSFGRCLFRVAWAEGLNGADAPRAVESMYNVESCKNKINIY